MARGAYAGDKRTLVLAFDIGTTFSGISYALLDPGQVPKINSVARSVSPLIFMTTGNSSERRLFQVPGTEFDMFEDSVDNLVRRTWAGSRLWS